MDKQEFLKDLKKTNHMIKWYIEDGKIRGKKKLGIKADLEKFCLLTGLCWAKTGQEHNMMDYRFAGMFLGMEKSLCEDIAYVSDDRVKDGQKFNHELRKELLTAIGKVEKK